MLNVPSNPNQPLALVKLVLRCCWTDDRKGNWHSYPQRFSVGGPAHPGSNSREEGLSNKNCTSVCSRRQNGSV